MFILLLIELFSVQVAHADEDWFCTEDSSTRTAQIFQSCGIGLGTDENTARLNAFDNANNEFRKICDLSFDCKNQLSTVVPKRSRCRKTGNQYKCYRLLEFTIIPNSQKSDPSKSKTPDNPQHKNDQVEEPQVQLGNQISDPTKKLKKGLRKSEVISMFGVPRTAEEQSDLTTSHFSYTDKDFCVYTICSVWFKGGRVNSWSNFKPIFTTDLDDIVEPKKALSAEQRNAIRVKKEDAIVKKCVESTLKIDGPWQNFENKSKLADSICVNTLTTIQQEQQTAFVILDSSEAVRRIKKNPATLFEKMVTEDGENFGSVPYKIINSPPEIKFFKFGKTTPSGRSLKVYWAEKAKCVFVNEFEVTNALAAGFATINHAIDDDKPFCRGAEKDYVVTPEEIAKTLQGIERIIENVDNKR